MYEKLKVLEDGMNTYLGEGNASVENNWNLGIAFCALCGAYNAHEEVLGIKWNNEMRKRRLSGGWTKI